ncbi:MAG TPA: four helix bundle protein [Chitinophagaceae bacterium]|nr:four helix bundle protein [Chitinophagaceae bacterium]
MATIEIKFGFEQLELWKKVRAFKKEVIEEAKKWSAEEKFKLIDQTIRSSRSINALLAEGHGRFTFADQLHFCIQARGSLSETINHLIDAIDEEYITAERLNYFKEKGKEIERMLNGYIKFLRNQRDGEKK